MMFMFTLLPFGMHITTFAIRLWIACDKKKDEGMGMTQDTSGKLVFSAGVSD